MSKLINLVLGVLFVVFGIYLWNNPDTTLIAYCLYVGIMYLITAIILLIACLVKHVKPFPTANIILDFLIGIIILAIPVLSLFVIMWLFVIGFLFVAIFYLYVAIKARKVTSWHTVKICLGVIGVICGLIMLFNPVIGFATLAKVIALMIMLNGIGYIIPGIFF